MGFLDNLKRGKVPDELPDLAIDDSKNLTKKEEDKKKSEVQEPTKEKKDEKANNSNTTLNQKSETRSEEEKFVFDIPSHLKEEETPKLSKESYFDKILEDINKDIENVSSIEEWYNQKIANKDVVSDMKGYWEENKHEFIIKGIGSEYKKKINEKIAKLQELEMDWREIYFKLIKKEEEMKKEERELKAILSEFVDICKRRGAVDEEKKS